MITNYGTIQNEQNAWRCEHDLKRNDKLRVKRYMYDTGLLANFLPLQKVNFKATPIERQSL